METNTILTIVFSVVAIVSAVVAGRAFWYCKDKVLYIFGGITAAASVGSIIMGSIIHRWWVWVPAIILLVIALAIMLLNCITGDSPSGPFDDED